MLPAISPNAMSFQLVWSKSGSVAQPGLDFSVLRVELANFIFS